MTDSIPLIGSAAPMAAPAAPRQVAGPAIKLTGLDIMRWRNSGASDDAIHSTAQKIDPNYGRIATGMSQYKQQQGQPLDPTWLLNKHYLKDIDNPPVEPKRAAIMQTAMQSAQPDTIPLLQQPPQGPNMFQRMGQDITGAADNLDMDAADHGAGRTGLLHSMLRGMGDLATGAVSVLSEPVKSAMNFNDSLPGSQMNAASHDQMMGKIAGATGAPDITGQTDPATAAYTAWQQKHPEAAKDFQSVASLVSLPMAMQGMSSGMGAMQDGVSGKLASMAEKKAAAAAQAEAMGNGPINQHYNTAFKPAPTEDSLNMRTHVNNQRAAAVTELSHNLDELGVKTPTNAAEAAQVHQKMLDRLGQGMEDIAKTAESKGVTVSTKGLADSLREFAKGDSIQPEMKRWAQSEAARYDKLGELTPTRALRLEKDISKMTQGKTLTQSDATRAGALSDARKTLLEDINHSIGASHDMGDGSRIYSELNKSYARQKTIQPDINLTDSKLQVAGQPGIAGKVVDGIKIGKSALTAPLHPLRSLGQVANIASKAAAESDQIAAVKKLFQEGKSAVDKSKVPILKQLKDHLDELKSMETIPREAPPSTLDLSRPGLQGRTTNPNAGAVAQPIPQKVVPMDPRPPMAPSAKKLKMLKSRPK